jgi:bacillopeptidase F
MPLSRTLPTLLLLGSLALGTASCFRGQQETVSSPSAASPVPVLDPVLAERLDGAPAESLHTVLVDLGEQVDLRGLCASMARQELAVPERARRVREALREVAERRETSFEPFLLDLLEEELLDWYRGVAIVNRVVVIARPEAIRRIAGHPEVARVWPGLRVREEAGRSGERSPSDPGGDAWALEAMGIPSLHARGLDGSGVRIGILDSGVSAEHLALAGARDEQVPSWFDPYRHRPEPYDSRGHGTRILSAALGRPVRGHAIGAAPGARWVAALANPENTYDSVTLTLAADWMLFEARPRIILNAWGHPPGSCYEEDRPLIDAWRAAEILPVFPAGNGGPDPGTGESPGTLTGLLPDGGPALSVGALDESLRPIPQSARGPRPCGEGVFPLLAAPGWKLPVPARGSREGLELASGTSLAVGWVGGAAALLLQARPDLGVLELEAALIEGARDLPPAGPDPATGHGLVRVDRSLAWLEREAPGPDPGSVASSGEDEKRGGP